MQLGAVGQSIGDLIERVRIAEPDAYLVYKPHPDVVAGLRKGLIDADADMVVTDADLLSLVDRADTVHILSSLAGFEALLRGKTVHVHGQPFYAGWGLTTDHNPPPRRGRRLALSELVAGALIAYPRYCHPATGDPIEVEELVLLLGQNAKSSYDLGAARRWAARAALGVRKLKGRACKT
jgi:capsular polysaccharide export protein